MNIKDEIKELREAFDILFEAKDSKDEKKAPVNKIKLERKEQGKEPTEVVSVADELFPYKGSAKEQFNQKVIAKINDMIEGTATLEDLINLVRQKRTLVREGFDGVEDIIKMMEEIVSESSHARKYGDPNAADGDTVGHTGTKFFKDGVKMHPHRVTKSNGQNGVSYAPHGTEYNDFDDKKVLQDAIKDGKTNPEGEDFKKIQKDLSNPSTKNDMYGKNTKWVANTLANRGNDYNSTIANTPKDTFGYTKGRMDKNKVKTDPTVLGRVEKTKKRILSKKESVGEALQILLEGRKEGESNADFKNRLHKELVLSIDKKVDDAKQNAIETYKKKGSGEEAQTATEKYKKEQSKLEKLDNIQPVANAYVRAEQDKPEDKAKDEMQTLKSERRNAEKNAKTHGYNAKQLEKKSIKAEEAGRERKAEALYDKANAEWDKETAEQQRAANAHHKVEELRKSKPKD